ncbi:MAG: HAMP domain-containing histidine kinase [Campylobacterales bacterium]|nr:HAMP domain-containing histidine kinase [Campylobacterales bacterium]
MSSGERKTVQNVLILYLASSIFLVFSFSYIYYDTQKQTLLKEQNQEMQKYAKDIFFKLQSIHNSLKNPSLYPRDNRFNSAIFDNKNNPLFSTLKNNDIEFDKTFYTKDGYSYLIYESSPYYMGAAYIVIEKNKKNVWTSIGKNIIFITFLVIVMIVLTSIFSVKLILKPLRENVKLLDNFIKDTTHELNTPISTIMTNMELLEQTALDAKITKKLNRIKTASMTISGIYEDLVFLVLNHQTSSKDEMQNINDIVKQRVDYFELFFKSKNITLNYIEDGKLFYNIDKNKMIRVIDNLISNAIKYTNKSTNIDIKITKNSFSICDEGDGMSEDEIEKIFERYTRFNDIQGGFGIGYNIIYTIISEYGIKIDIDSKQGGGTCVKLSF